MVFSEGDGMSNSKERDAVGELAELREDRDKWQTRAVQSEGRVKTLGQELAAMTSDRDGLDRKSTRLNSSHT